MLVQSMVLSCLFTPALGAVLARFFRKQAGFLVILGMGVSFWMGLSLFYYIAFDNALDLYQYTWGQYGPYAIHFGFWLDTLSLLMVLVVSGIAFLVGIYSLGYMKDDPNQHLFFSYIGFFVFAMLWLVLSSNLLQLFFGWEGVGLASYLLIGFWTEKEKASYASLKAFLLNRVGDMGLLFAMALILLHLGTLDYLGILSKGNMMMPFWGLRVIDWVCMGLFLACMAKSAQMPLHLWLPDSMVGPTPISALIHAATMVTAGVFLLARFSYLIEQSIIVDQIIVIIGGLTAILMGMVASTEHNIKRIIAYSTISQLGNMVVICGLSGYVFSIYHLVTHAIFKALLFLTAGAIIMAMDGEEDIRDMGNFRSHLTIHMGMLIGLASMVAIPPLGGFFSKDAILMLAKSTSLPVYYFIVFGSFLTALYSVRLYYQLFWVKKSSVLKPLPVSMLGVLWVLVCLSLIGGWMMQGIMPILTKVIYTHQPVDEIVELLNQPVLFIYYGIQGLAFWVTLLTLLIYPWLSLDVKKYRMYKVIKSGYGLEKGLEYLVFYYGLVSHVFAFWVERAIDFVCVYGASCWVFLLGRRFQLCTTGKLYHYIGMVVFAVMVFLLGRL